LKISVVVPLLDEAPNLPPLYEEIKQAVDTLPHEYEIIFVDDGSTDDSLDVLKQIQTDDDNVVIVEFRRNFGQTAGLAAGLDYATGDVVVTMDADRQNDPADIPKMLEKIEQGYDLVCGWRFDRQDTFISRKLPSMLANKLISKTTDVRLHDYGCTLKVMRAEVAKSITLYGEMHRFIPALASQIGVKIAEVKVNHRPRTMGTTKYGISRTFRVILDLITVKFLLDYNNRPIHFFGLPGLASGAAGFLLALYLTVQKIFGVSISDRPLLLLAVFLMMVGLQLILFGLLAELQMRTYHEGDKEKPIYFVKQIHASK